MSNAPLQLHTGVPPMPTSKKNAGAPAPSKNTSAVARTPSQNNTNPKLDSLEQFRSDATNQALTTNQGVKVSDNQNTLKAGPRGPSLLEDFIMREKITHFDHERIPERIVHARGTGAHGYFQTYENHFALTKAGFLQEPGKKTPVFTRFSTVQGPRGSGDTVRDVRGFAVKFFTDEGNFDLVGNNMPVFFIQDAIKFPDFVHAVKPEPHNEIPTGGSAHDTFWDFVSLQPESAHIVIWTMSDRAIPKSLRSMQGFGIHTFRLINAEGKSRFVKFHWRPTAGTCSLVWDEAQKLAGKDADFHRRDLWEAIDMGDYPEWELGVQIVEEDDEHSFDFDLLDPTKIIPEEIVPITMLGKLTLNRNPDNFFAETEQVAFCPGHIVPGIDFSNDPLLQGRLFSYTDTQISRLGGPNFHEIPINRPTCPYHNFQRDGMHRQDIDTNPANYEPNSLNDNWPRETPPSAQGGGFESYHERVDGDKVRQRSDSFGEFYSQPRLFWLSQTPVEQDHIVAAFSFELSKVARPYIRERVVDLLTHIDVKLAEKVAKNLGIKLSADALKTKPPKPVNGLDKDESLSLYASGKGVIKGRQVAILLSEGGNAADVLNALQAFQAAGVHPKLLASHLGEVVADDGSTLPVDATFAGSPSITVDALLVPHGHIDALLMNGDARHFVLEAYKHLKVMGLSGDARRFKSVLGLEDGVQEEGVIEAEKTEGVLLETFLKDMLKHRIWSRSAKAEGVPA